MLYALHALLALTAFMVVLNGFLRGANKSHIDVVLSVLLVSLFAAAFVAFGWKAGLLAVPLTFFYAIACRSLAARLAARLLASSGGLSGQYTGLPPRPLERISLVLGHQFSPEQTPDELLSGSHRQQKPMEALFDYCEANANVRDVMREFNATRDTLKDIYSVLLSGGAGQWAGGHYVAASAVAYPNTLRFLLEHPLTGRDEILGTVYKLIAHFETGAPLE